MNSQINRTTVAILAANDMHHARSLLPGCGQRRRRQCRGTGATDLDTASLYYAAGRHARDVGIDSL